LAVDGGELSASCPYHFTPRERASGTHWIGGWVGPRAVLVMVAKRKLILHVYITLVSTYNEEDWKKKKMLRMKGTGYTCK
jgi:hypothetical protein